MMQSKFMSRFATQYLLVVPGRTTLEKPISFFVVLRIGRLDVFVPVISPVVPRRP
jgi:hypothetical protein